MAQAAFLTDPSERPPNGQITWFEAEDGVRLRAAFWPGGAKGTVLMLPGRTEYIEKYGPSASELHDRGFSSATLDWRGQGLADHIGADDITGHVGDFLDFQKDLRAFVAEVEARPELPRPYYMLAHSMGGAIGLRGLIYGLDVKAAVFTGPMWGILIRPHMRPVAHVLGAVAHALGFGDRPIPGMDHGSYGARVPFEGNMLTTDQEMYALMHDHVVDHPQLALGAPSMSWLYTALRETDRLKVEKLPDVPSLIGIGNLERVVDPDRIREMAARWSSAELIEFNGAEHEILMEVPEVREDLYSRIAAHFSAAG
ncbi:MAG: alpha/beta hydrolase [Pseudomonadota bacterium]